MTRPFRACAPALVGLAAALTLAACATAPGSAPSAPTAQATPAAAPPSVVAVPAAPAQVIPARDRIRRAIDMLGRGQRDPARSELMLVLGEQPTNKVARGLLDQIDKDPKALLGERSYPYKVRPGETLSILADRFLGDPLMFYALARYNGIVAPDATEVGQTLMIPGTPRRAAPAPAQAQASAPKPAAPTADPGRANGLRRTALEAMNKGSIDQAVALLQQAAPLDPANSLIRADLERAMRIQQSVRRR